jgi:hypothetical protein
MTKKGTVLALQPHQYQPITLGPDYTKANKPQVVWNPLQGNLEPLATPQNLNANKNTKSDLKVWDYWSIKGSLRSYVIPDSFTTAYPFQNFLPVMPAPKFERTFKQTGIAAVNIVNTGTGYKKINKVPTVTIKTGTNPQIPGTGAGAKALIDDNTSQVLQVDVVSPGNDYPNGLPPKGVTVEIEPPVAGTQATAYPQTGGGSLLAVFMINKGSGYSSIINVDQKGLDNVIDPPVILPNFDKDGNLLAGPAIIRESGAGFNFSTTTQPVAQLFTGSGSGAVLQVVQPGTIYKYGVPITGGGVAGGYPSSSAQGNPPDYVKVHVQPPPSGGPAQEATASFSRISGVGSPPIAITNPGLYSNVAGVYATYKNSQGTESSRLPVTFEPSGSNYKVKGVEGASLPVDVPTALTFHGGTVVTKPVAQINPYYSLKAIATQVGSYTGTDNFSASFVDDAGSTIRLLTSWSQTDGKFYISDIAAPSAYLTKPKTAQITGGSFSQQAEITVFPVWFVSQVISGSNIATGYNKDAQVSFTGNSFSTDADIRVPNLTFKIPGTPGNRNVIAPSDIKIVDGGKGLFSGRPIDFLIEGGRGLDAILDPVIVSGTLSAVRVIQNGNNYLPNVIAQISHGGGTGAQVKVNVLGSTNYISSVTVTNGGSGYTHAPTITLLSGKPTDNAAPDPVIWENPKGVPAVFTASVTNGSISKIEKLPVPPNRPNPIYARYYAGSENTATTKSTPSSLVYRGTPQFSTYTSASLWYATPAPDETEVEQVLYSSLISTYAKLSSASLAPFGGAYLGDAAPDGYGLGGQISGAAKFVGDIYNMQQKYKTIPKAIPLDYATAAGKAPFAAGDNTWEFRVQQENNPYFTLSGALKTSVQSLQRSLSMLFMEPPSHNNPSEIFKSTTWKMDYFSQIDSGVGRIIINPTATQPAWGINSSTQTPGDLTSLNDGKTGLSKWNKGMLWSGFGVSDQWNDQHYFYGYYLSSAALAGLLDRAWEDTPGRRGGAPDKLWASKEEMGAGMDQLLLTLAYDPDSKDLQDPNTGYYRIPSLEYQKLAFFDQWSGQPWATGAMPGSTVATLDFEKDPFAYWRSFGTDSDKFDGENENSIFEGIQAWSAAILWGGATDRKSVVDLGIYLYSTNLAAADSYFLDKNYNLVNSSLNKHSWVPVTTIDASLVAKNGNNDDLPYPSGQTGPRWPAGTDYASASPVAYYTAPEFFGDENGTTISPGQSLMKKSASTLNNFFYAFPTGSKFIQAYPPTSWTLGMARNTTYMKKWAGAMMRQEWNDARNSALYQPADWLGLAMTSALAGVPYNPGDVPYPLTGKTPSAKKVDKYLNRLWSSWVTPYDAPGSNASRTPPFLAHSILTFLLALDDYGVPDWTYIGVATGPAGGEDPKSVVFTAVFTKEPQPGDTSVTTTFVAFNPGWETRHAKFQRLDKDGEVTKGNISGTLMIKPKETVLKTMSFSIGTGAPLATGPTATAEDDQTRLERLKELLKNN